MKADELEPTETSKKEADPKCKVCLAHDPPIQRRYSEHAGKRCPSCFDPIEHHFTQAETDACWMGRAKMAVTLDPGNVNDVDREALRRFPPDTHVSTWFP